MKKWDTLFIGLLMASALFVSPVLGSMSGLMISDKVLAETADIIVVCKVVSVSVESHRTVYWFEAIEAVKGTIDKEFMIKTREGTNIIVTPTPIRFTVGDELLLYLVEEGNGYYVAFDYWGKKQLSLVDEGYLDSLREDYFGSVNNPQQYLMITGGVLLIILAVIGYGIKQRTKL